VFALTVGMRYETIVKTKHDSQVAPNLPNYEQARAAFSWEQARTQLAGLPGGHGVNIAHEAIDRHAAGQRGNQVALRWLGKTGQARNYTYLEMRKLTNRFANVLQSLDIGAKDRVFVLAGRVPELYVAALGTLKNRSVFCSLFSAFGPEPIRTRLSIGNAKVLVTTPLLFERKIVPLLSSLAVNSRAAVVSESRLTSHSANSLRFQEQLELP
jgi:acetyl-CoA synthetase